MNNLQNIAYLLSIIILSWIIIKRDLIELRCFFGFPKFARRINHPNMYYLERENQDINRVWETRVKVIDEENREDFENIFIDYCRENNIRSVDTYFNFQYNGHFVAFIQHEVLLDTEPRFTPSHK